MAAQHTLNASPMQACRSSWVSAIAVEHKKGIVKATAIKAGTFFELADSMGFCFAPGSWRQRARETKAASRFARRLKMLQTGAPFFLAHHKMTIRVAPMTRAPLWIKNVRR
jgi:hypothetical protein